jgi:hypothetical protein
VRAFDGSVGANTPTALLSLPFSSGAVKEEGGRPFHMQK